MKLIASYMGLFSLFASGEFSRQVRTFLRMLNLMKLALKFCKHSSLLFTASAMEL